MLHVRTVLRVWVENRAIVGEIISEQQISVAVPVEIALDGSAGEPDLVACDQLDSMKCRLGQQRFGVAHKNYWRAAPIINQHICRAVFVEIPHDTTHWSDCTR